MNIKRFHDHIFVEPITEEKVTKSVFVCRNVEEKPMIGKVIAVGPEKPTKRKINSFNHQNR